MEIKGTMEVLGVQGSRLDIKNNTLTIGGRKITIEGGTIEHVRTDNWTDNITIRVKDTIKMVYGTTGSTVFDDPKYFMYSPTIKKKKPNFNIKKIQINPAKNATTVIFEDGKVVVLRKHESDPDVDLASVVAYAIAEKAYGSNTAFKKHIRNCKIEFIRGNEVFEAESVL